MQRSEISSSDILSWTSAKEIADSFEKLGFEIMDVFDEEVLLTFARDPDKQMLVRITDDVEGEDRDFQENVTLAFFAKRNFDEFALIGRVSEDIGASQYHEYRFTATPFEENSEIKYDILDIINTVDAYKQTSVEEALDINPTIRKFNDDCEYLLNHISEHIYSEKPLTKISREEYVQSVFQRIVYSFLLQEKGLLDRSQSRPLRRKHAEIDAQGDVFFDYYEPLFAGELESIFPQAPDTLFNIQLFADTEAESKDEFLRVGESPEESEAVFDELLTTLEGWDWQTNVDFRSRRIDALSPLVIGAAFEQSVQSKREGSTLYTPRRFTGFARRNAILPTLEEELQSDTEINASALDEFLSIEDYSSLSGNYIQSLNHFHSEILAEFAILDPVMGGGSYIKEAVDTMIDIRLPILRAARANPDTWEGELVERISSNDSMASLRSLALRDTISQNVHGVDMDPRAVQATVFRIYLDAVATVPPVEEYDPQTFEFQIPHVGLNLHRGNSLFGTVSTSKSPFQSELSEFTGDNVNDLNNLKNRYKEAVELVEALQIRQNLIEKLSTAHKQIDERFKEKITERLGEEIQEETYISLAPFHWPIFFPQVMESGGFDVILGNLPQDFFAFDNQFGFNQERQSSIDDKNIKENETKSASRIIHEFLTTQEGYPTGSTRNTQIEELFWNRSLELVRDSGRICFMFSTSLLDSYSSTPLRKRLFEGERIETLFTFSGKSVFKNRAAQSGIALGTVQRSPPLDQFQGRFNCIDLEVLADSSNWIDIPIELITTFAPESYIPPNLESQQEVEVIKRLCSFPVLCDSTGYDLTPVQEVVRSRSQEVTITDSTEGDYPILSGRDIYLYSFDSTINESNRPPERWSIESSTKSSVKQYLKQRQLKHLEEKLDHWLHQRFERPPSVDDYLHEERGKPLTIEDARATFELPRIAYRDVARARDERTMIATVVPPGIPCIDTLHVVDPIEFQLHDVDSLPNDLYEIQKAKYNPEELLALTGVMNSLPFDYLIRKRIGSGVHLSNYIVKNARAPVDLDDESRIARLVAKLNCYGEEFDNLRSDLGIQQKDLVLDDDHRSEVMAEIDALVFTAFGFERQAFVDEIVQSFGGTRSPRVINRDYQRKVRDRFSEVNQ